MKLITCSDVNILKELPLMDTDICATNQVQFISTCCVGVLLLLMSIGVWLKFRQR